jgi:hypothetical protein
MRIKPEYFNQKYVQMGACGYSVELCQLVMSCVNLVPEKRVSFEGFLQVIGGGGGGNVNNGKIYYS